MRLLVAVAILFAACGERLAVGCSAVESSVPLAGAPATAGLRRLLRLPGRRMRADALRGDRGGAAGGASSSGFPRSRRLLAHGVPTRRNSRVRLRHSHFFTADGQFGSRDQDGSQVDDGTYRIVDEARSWCRRSSRRHVPLHDRWRSDRVRPGSPCAALTPSKRMERVGRVSWTRVAAGRIWIVAPAIVSAAGVRRLVAARTAGRSTAPGPVPARRRVAGS